GGGGRRRGAYEAPWTAADGGTRPGGAEWKGRGRPRLPAPPSRVTLLEQRLRRRRGHAERLGHARMGHAPGEHVARAGERGVAARRVREAVVRDREGVGERGVGEREGRRVRHHAGHGG